MTRPLVLRGASYDSALRLSGQRAVPVVAKHLRTRIKWAKEVFLQRIIYETAKRLTEAQAVDIMTAVQGDLRRWIEADEATTMSNRGAEGFSEDERAAALNPFTGETDPRFCLLCHRLCDWRRTDWYWVNDPQHATHFRCVRT